MKRLITSMLIVLLISVAFIGSYYKGYYCYADDNINYMSDAELEAAYQAYLQSKGGGLIGNAGARLAYTQGKMLNFLTSEYNTTPFKNLNEVKGLMAWQKAELESGNSSVLQLAMSQGGASVFSLYTQWLLQNHYFGNGVTESDGMFDDGVDNNLYSGKTYTDPDGHTCLVWICSSLPQNANYPSDKIQYRGSAYIYNTTQLVAMNGSSVTYQPTSSQTITKYILSQSGVYRMCYQNGFSYGTDIYGSYSDGDTYSDGKAIISYIPSSDKYYFSGYMRRTWSRYNTNTETFFDSVQLIFSPEQLEEQVENVNINFYTNINNNIINYPDINADGTLYITPKVKINGEYSPYIVNEGDSITNVVNNYYNDSGEKDNTITEPSDQPSGSGGGSGGSGGTPPNWSNPYPNLSPDGSGGFNFNFTIPDLNIDWNINGLSEKFPFSIPFDLIRFVSILNAEPETPEFQGTINLIVYQWQIDADLSDFDNLAGIVRNVEFIGFCITLILITRKMIKG